MKKNAFKNILIMFLFIISINFVFADTEEVKQSPLSIARSTYGGYNYGNNGYNYGDNYGDNYGNNYGNRYGDNYDYGNNNGFGRYDGYEYSSNGRTDETQLTINQLERAISNIKSSISKSKNTLNESKEAATQKINDVDDSIKGFGDKVKSSEKKEIEKLEKSLKSAIGDVSVSDIEKINVTELESMLGEIKKIYNSVNSRYSYLYGFSSSKELDNRIKALNNMISEAHEDIYKIDSKVDIINEKIDELGKKHAEISDRITTAGKTAQEWLAKNGKQTVATTYGTYDGYTKYLEYLENQPEENHDDEFICEGSVKTLKETSFYDPGLITATMPICKRKEDSLQYIQINGGDRMMTAYQDEQQWLDYEFIKTVGHIRQKIWSYRGDNKGYAELKYSPLCLEPEARGWGVSQCEWREYTAKVCKSCCDGPVTCELPAGITPSPEALAALAGCTPCEPVYDCPEPNPAPGAPKWVPDAGDTCHRDWTEPYENFYTYKTGGYDDDTEGPLNRLQLLNVDKSATQEYASNKVRTDGTAQCEADLGTDWCNCLDTPKHPIIYAFLCPHYKCELKPTTTGICTPSFEEKEGGSTVYCINPSQPFTNTFRTEQDFTRDDTINPKNCESSFASLDCGFINILIESEYFNRITVNKTLLDEEGNPRPKPLINKIPQKTIEFALRLWSVHNGQQGFDKMGISNRQMSSRTGNCDNTVYYMHLVGEDDWVNVYKESHIYLFEKILEKITDEKVTEIDLSNNDHINLFEYTCQKDVLGVACEDNGALVYSKYSKEYYKYAYALVANTILGNDYMQAHLNELFDDYDLTVRTTRLVKDYDKDNKSKTYQYVEVIYEDLERVIEENNYTKEPIPCDEAHLAQYPLIRPYCQVKVQIVNANGEVIGDGLMDTDLSKSYCTKNYCRFKTVSFAICDLASKVISPIKISVKRRGNNSSDGIKKYINCSNPVDNQIMYGFDADKVIVDENGKPIKSSEPEMVTDLFPLTDYRCIDACVHYEVRDKVNNKCKDEFEEYDQVYTSSIKDPSLRCILNMADTNTKNLYNYSEEFGLVGTNNSKNLVNNKFCKIYCSDSVEYYMADKVRSKSGRPFEFNIESKVRSERSARYEFSNIIRLKRTCVSEIYYNRTFTDAYDWKKIYDLGSSDIDKKMGRDDGLTKEEIDNIKNWQDLFKVLKKKAESEGYRNENLNKLLYDLMNCNLYTNKQIEESVKLTDKEKEDGIKGVTRPQDDKVGNIRELIMKHFTIENNYGIGTNNYGLVIKDGKYPNSEACNISYVGEKGDSKGKVKEGGITDNNCVTMKTIDYNYGKNNQQLTQVDMESQTSNRNNFSKLVYCTGDDCFKWKDEMRDDKNNDPGDNSEYNYPNSADENGNYVGNQTTTIIYPMRDGKSTYIDGNGNTPSKVVTKVKDRTVEIPTNDYVMFEIQTDIAFYNDSRFEVDPLGETYEVNTEEIDKNSANFLLEPYLFPVSKHAYSFDNYCKRRDFLDPSVPAGAEAKSKSLPIAKRCGINQNFDIINTYFRKDPGDEFAFKVSNTKEFKCYVDVEKPSPTGCDHPPCDYRDSVIYKNIDLAFVFPSAKKGYSDVFKSNWNTVLGKKTTDSVKKSADTLKVTDKYLEYKITLSPYDILNIREYNKTNGKYIDENQLSCQKLPYNSGDGEIDDKEETTDPDNTQQSDVFVECKSPFLNNLRSSNEYGTIDSEFNGLNINKDKGED